MIHILDDDDFEFPNPYDGNYDGEIAVGGNLHPDKLIEAYSKGIFPWYGFKESYYIEWWCPLSRFVIFANEIHISHSMRQLIRRGTYHVTFNQAFDRVIRHCSQVDHRYDKCGAWLGDDMIDAYTALHDMHRVASVEVWDKSATDKEKPHGTLVGGLYGVIVGQNFCGESMFSLVPSASKLALIALAKLLQPYDGVIDCQFHTPHLESMGGRYISYENYMDRLHREGQEEDVFEF